MIHQAAQSIPLVCSTVAAKKSSGSILDPIAKPIADVLAFFYSIVPNYAVAILVLSLVWMVLISPLTLKTTRSMLAMQKLSPEMKRLQEQHRNDRQALAAAQMELYKTHNVSPFGSCLPSILPLPVFIALFRVIDGLSHKTTVHGVACATPKYLAHNTAMYHAIQVAGGHLNAFGLDLAKSALSTHTSVGTALPFYILLLIMMATQYVQTAQMMSRNPAAQQNSQMAIMKYLPLLFGVICIRFPAGVVLYYAMSNLCRIAQQELMYRFDPKVKTLAIRDVIEIEASAGVTDDQPASGMFSRRKDRAAATPAASRTRFRDMLGNTLQDQAAAREQAGGRKALPKGGAGGSRPNRDANRGGSKPASTSTPTRGTAKAGGSPANRRGATGRNGQSGTTGSGSRSGADSGSTGDKRATPTAPSAATRKGAPTKSPTPPTSETSPKAGRAGPKPAARSDRSDSPSTGGAASSQNDKPVAPSNPSSGNGRSNPPRTGAGSGRTGGRTGAQGSRNKRRGR